MKLRDPADVVDSRNGTYFRASTQEFVAIVVKDGEPRIAGTMPLLFARKHPRAKREWEHEIGRRWLFCLDGKEL